MIESEREAFVVVKEERLDKLHKSLKEINDTYFKFKLTLADLPIGQESVEKIVKSVEDYIGSEIHTRT
ncbi:hypothetical protein EIN_421840, partial [Entamoeba invadens IP1]